MPGSESSDGNYFELEEKRLSPNEYMTILHGKDHLSSALSSFLCSRVQYLWFIFPYITLYMNIVVGGAEVL
jgi:hypothetical protein